ncbi:uncharacterized protein N7483_009121 [Penicillium malachiteum]|uniref:uncharacterized protein n=1 Tax=Penicillium malachiteum TaxID=1324776 RepID=UPI002547C428|nr:uncharacterized protein N7483_009121 [Penicillium malachiteum]KAJ5721187.1 hypothetical protein N7483_009121 [Penicillium malachiteum]
MCITLYFLNRKKAKKAQEAAAARGEKPPMPSQGGAPYDQQGSAPIPNGPPGSQGTPGPNGGYDQQQYGPR